MVFYNGISGEYILSIEGLCSLGNNDGNKRLSVTCKTGPSAYKKHYLGLSDNVTFFAEQVAAAGTLPDGPCDPLSSELDAALSAYPNSDRRRFGASTGMHAAILSLIPEPKK